MNTHVNPMTDLPYIKVSTQQNEARGEARAQDREDRQEHRPAVHQRVGSAKLTSEGGPHGKASLAEGPGDEGEGPFSNARHIWTVGQSDVRLLLS